MLNSKTRWNMKSPEGNTLVNARKFRNKFKFKISSPNTQSPTKISSISMDTFLLSKKRNELKELSSQDQTSSAARLCRKNLGAIVGLLTRAAQKILTNIA